MSKDKYVVEQVLGPEALKARVVKCQAENLCFISLKPFTDEASRVVLRHSVGNVAVLAEYADRSLLG